MCTAKLSYIALLTIKGHDHGETRVQFVGSGL